MLKGINKVLEFSLGLSLNNGNIKGEMSFVWWPGNLTLM